MGEIDVPKCPKCWCEHCPAIRSVKIRIRVHGGTKEVTRRRRKCRYCGFDFYTREEDEEPPVPDEAPDSTPNGLSPAMETQEAAPAVIVPTAPPRPSQLKPVKKAAAGSSSQERPEESEPANPFL